MRTLSVRNARLDEIAGDTWTVPAGRIKGSEGAGNDMPVHLSSAAVETGG
ncbi:hypothetical protein [Jannaschia faecimaris]|nr:hypothetical protein [Jannaschia faecimaris]